jgi:excisionase family DNA binding protein
MSKLESEIERLIEPVVERVVAQRLAEVRPAEPEQYLSVKHAARLLDVPEDTIRKWLQRGQLTRYRVRGCVRVRVSELLRAEG